MEGNEPFVGLRPYATNERHRFHGRGREVAELMTLWRGGQLSILHGVTGAGKTSLLNVVAGLMRADADIVLPVGRLRLGSTFPSAVLPTHNAYSLAVMSSMATGEAPTRLVGTPLAEFVHRLAGPASRSNGGTRPTFVAIDQVETLFQDGADSDQRNQFLTELDELMRVHPHVQVLLCVRDRAAPNLIKIVTGHEGRAFGLRPLTPEAAAEVLTKSLDATGTTFAPGVAEILVDRLRTTGIDTAGSAQKRLSDLIAPTLVQVVLSAVWRTLAGTAAVITRRHVPSGLVEQALTAYLDDSIDDAATELGLPSDEVSAWLLRTLVDPDGRPGSVAWRSM